MQPVEHPSGERSQAAVARLAYGLLLLTTLCWGANAIAGRIAPGHISPAVLTFLRWFGTALLIALLFRQTLATDRMALRRHWKRLLALGALGFAIFNLALYAALNFTTVINVALFQAGIPITIIALNLAFFAEPIRLPLIAAIALGLGGVGVVATRGDLSALFSLQLNLGDAIMLIAIFAFAGYTVALRTKPKSLAWQSTMGTFAAGATLASLPGIAAEYAIGAIVWPDATGWAIAAFSVIFPSLIGQALFIRGNELIGANSAGLFINMVPIWGTVLAVLLLGERLEAYHLVAALLIVCGIALGEVESSRRAA